MLNKKGIKKAYILLYAFFMGSLCIFSSLFILKMENIKWKNSNTELHNLSKINDIQKDREHLLSYIDKLFYDNLKNIDLKGVNNFIKNLDENFNIRIGNSSAYFYNGALIIDYYRNNQFYKQEKYKIYIKDSNINYDREYVSYERKVIK